MPTYEYECEKCARRFEKFQSITEKPIRKCPTCGAKTRRLIGSGAGFIFKGSGFYQTDYRSENYKKRAAADQPKKDSASQAKPSSPENKSASRSSSPGEKTKGS